MDKYGYIGIETLLNFHKNSKDHAVTPNDFMRMNRVRLSETPWRKNGMWIKTGQSFVFPEKFMNYSCSECGYDVDKIKFNFCPNCGADMRGVK